MKWKPKKWKDAAVAELNAIIQSLIQRNINLAGDLAVAQQQLKETHHENPVSPD